MADRGFDPYEVQRTLGELLAQANRGSEDRALMLKSLETLQDKVGAIGILSHQFDEHERLDSQRHEENQERLGAIEKRLVQMEAWRNQKVGGSGAVKWIVGVVIAALSALAAFIALWK